MAAVPVTVDVAPVGPPALAALGRRVADIQGGDPLAPVTVVVSRGAVGLAARRALAAGGGGVCNVRFVTLGALAGLVGGAAMAATGRRPLTPAVVRAAAAQAAAAAPADVASGGEGSEWAAAAGHPATLDALGAVFHELADVPAAQRRRLAAQGRRPAALVALADDMAARLADWYGPADVADAAAAELVRRPDHWRRWLGGVVLHLPERPPAGADSRLLGAVAAVTDVSVVAGRTGDDEVDAELPALVDALASIAPPDGTATAGAVLGANGRDQAAPPSPEVTRLTAPAADAEVLAACRWLAERWRAGTPLSAMALVLPAAAPYPRLAHDLLAAAGLPSNGPGHRPLSATVAGRVLLGALALPDHRWRRDDTVAWMASGPLLDPADGRPVPVGEWDRASRAAGVVGGLDQWRDRLAARARALRRRAAAVAGDHGLAEDGDPGLRRAAAPALLDAATGTERLGAFVAWLADRLAQDPVTWAGWSAWAQRLLTDLLGGPVRRDGWPAEERQAFDDVAAAVAGLAEVGALVPAADRAAFHHAVAAALRVPAAGTARAGHGLLVGPPEVVAGTGRPVVAVVGLAEGWLPAPMGEDTVLGEAARQAAGMAPSPRRRRWAAARRAFAAVLGEADQVLLCASRSDPGSGRAQWPSPWWGPADACGTTVDVASHPDVVADVGEPLDPADHRLRSALRWRVAVGTLDGHPLVAAADRARRLTAARARRSRAYSRFEGRVGPGVVPSPFGGPPRSPTALERYAVCPRAHFFQHVLAAVDIPKPEAVDRISALDRGLLVHEVLEHFLAPEVARPPEQRRRPDQPWGEEDRRRLLRIFDEVAGRYERTGRTGWPVLWALDRAAIARDLLDFLAHDDRFRAERGAVPEAVELRFGDDEPVEVAVAGDRRLRFHGTLDRVDRTPGGAVVIDYKTGRADRYRDLQADPVAAGTRLQLPVYALAAARRLGDVPVEAHYWFVTGAGGFERAGYPVGPDVLGRFTESVTTLAEGIEAGHFPARPGEATHVGYRACRNCDYDAACPVGRDGTWASVRLDPALADLVALLEPGDGGHP